MVADVRIHMRGSLWSAEVLLSIWDWNYVLSDHIQFFVSSRFEWVYKEGEENNADGNYPTGDEKGCNLSPRDDLGVAEWTYDCCTSVGTVETDSMRNSMGLVSKEWGIYTYCFKQNITEETITLRHKCSRQWGVEGREWHFWKPRSDLVWMVLTTKSLINLPEFCIKSAYHKTNKKNIYPVTLHPNAPMTSHRSKKTDGLIQNKLMKLAARPQELRCNRINSLLLLA